MPLMNKDNLVGPIQISAVLKGTVITIMISFFLSIGTGIIYHFSAVTEQTIPWFAGVILATSAFGGSLFTGKKAGSRGLYHGLAVGVLFFLVAWLAAWFISPGQAVLGIVYKLLLISFSSVLGGIIGVGLS